MAKWPISRSERSSDCFAIRKPIGSAPIQRCAACSVPVLYVFFLNSCRRLVMSLWRPAETYFPLIAASTLMWFSSRIVPIARCNAALAFTYELRAATSVERACASRLSY
jgi:hypothetical protein